MVQYLSDIYVVFYFVNYSVLLYKFNHLLLTRMKPSDFDYLKLIGKGSFGKVRILLYMHINKKIFAFDFKCSTLCKIHFTNVS